MKWLDDDGGRYFAQATSSHRKVGVTMSEKDISKIFALLYEIKKRITKLEKNMIEGKKDNQINSNENNNDFTRGSTLW